MNEREAMGCPDAETLAAWSDGGLRADERSRVEDHAAACGRCQAHLAAIARMAAADQEPARSTTRHRFWPWLVPSAGVAAAVVVWVVVQPVRLPDPPPQTSPQLRPFESDKADAIRDRAEPMPSPAETPSAVSQRAEPKLEASATERRNRANAAPAARPPAAPPAAVEESVPMSAARAADASAIVSLVVHRSPEGRVTWQAGDEISSQLVAGASPSPSVIWLVGKGGLVLLSTDGRSWRRLPFPEAVDLTGVEASSDTTATVTTADAHVFTTADGGLTWLRK